MRIGVRNLDFTRFLALFVYIRKVDLAVRLIV
jgi:hypothetical protein